MIWIREAKNIMAGIWGIKPWVGRTLEEARRDRSAMDSYTSLEVPEDLTPTIEKSGGDPKNYALGPPSIGPVSLDPTDYIGPGTLAKIGTGSTAMVVGAFRSAETSMLSRGLIKTLKEGKTEEVLRSIIPGDELPFSSDLVLQSFVEKLGDKELAKYGTPEFVLDKFLHSTLYNEGAHPLGVELLTQRGLLQGDAARRVGDLNWDRADLIKSGPTVLGPEDSSYEKALNRGILSAGIEVEDFLLAKKQGKSLYTGVPNSNFQAYKDIAQGLLGTVRKARELDIPEEMIARKSPQQLVSLITDKEDAALKILKKSTEARTVIIATRTKELMATNPDKGVGELGFVKLTDMRDLSHETAVLNHCLAGICRERTKYVPAIDPVTGVKHKITENAEAYAATSAGVYQKKLDEGWEYYSFRPKGEPVMTIEVSPKKVVTQAYGFEDSDPSPEAWKALESLAERKGWPN